MTKSAVGPLDRAVCLLATALIVGIVALPAVAAAAAPDHFSCYKASGAAGSTAFNAVTGVTLVDGFGSSTATVLKPQNLCAPTSKNNEDPSAPSHPDHLTDFRIKRSTAFVKPVSQHMVDQFGSLMISVVKPTGLQVPSAKSLSSSPTAPSSPAVDHFQCYRVKVTTGTTKFTPRFGVTAQDQFGSLTVEIKKPRRLCAPVNKNNEAPGAENHPDYLMCYQVKQTSLPKFAPISPIFVNHQFGPETLQARKPMELCVPAARNPSGGPTATRTATPVPTATRTATPTSVGGGGTTTPTSTRTPTPVSTTCVLPNPIPEVLSYAAKPGVDLDSGWTGVAHDAPGVDESSVGAVRVSGCDTTLSSPTCGQCTTDGPILFPGGSKNCRCTNLSSNRTNIDASSLSTCDPEMPSTCTAPETCECYYGPPLPISAGAVPVCVINRYTSSVSGTANIATTGPHAGEGQATLRLEASVHNGLTVDKPCPTCLGDSTAGDGVKNGTCSGGAKNNQACDVSGTSPFFGPMSFDCPPLHAAGIGNLTVTFNPATTGTTSLGTAGVKCTNATHTSEDCFCDTCATAAAQPCNSNADCTPYGAGVTCGGLRCKGGANVGALCPTAGATSICPGSACGTAGTATRRNQCDDNTCSADMSDPATPNDGVCATGPFDSFCSTETFRGCGGDVDCNPPPSGSCDSCQPNQVCGGGFRNCFLDPIVRTGTPGTQNAVLAATFCIPPTTAPAVNDTSGLPGPGALLQPIGIFRSGALCGNGVVNPGETCDPPNDSACPGLCGADCKCPTCGDNHLNQPSEQCDGSDDANCPGACQPSCQCSASCGNNIVEFGEQCDGSATNGQCPPSACQGNCTCGPYCGDNIVNGSEQCDGSAGNGQCPASACQTNCTCGPYCGDGVINGSEQCDGSATGSCSGGCLSNCTCAPVCGNNIKEPGELCDGSDAASCPGNCQADCTCPPIGTVTFVIGPGADLDNGWTGTSHDFGLQEGSTISGEIGACDGMTDTNCTFFSNIGSRCSGNGNSCTDTTQCPVGQTCIINTYGPPLPLSSGGVPVCVINRFAGNVTGTYDTASGDSEINVPLNSLVYLGTDVNRPCPICNCGNADPNTCAIGSAGTCSDNPTRNCHVQGKGPFGPTSNECAPNPGSNISGGGLNITFNPAATHAVTPFAATIPCTASGFTNQMCWCPSEAQPSACQNGCDGGTNDAAPCSGNSACPGGGVCKPLCRSIAGQTRPGQGVQAVGEAECVVGPFDQTCSGAHAVTCTSDTQCIGVGTCVTEARRCFLDPIERVGTPGTTTNFLASTFCIPATTSPAVNNVAGLPGPGAVRYPNSVNANFCGDGIVNQASEECDGASAPNCPGQCQPDCTCSRTCGNNVREFGEQCDGTDSPTCTPPNQATSCNGPTASNPCTCVTQVCGDGFAGPGEQCDPGGAGGSPPPDDSACPGQCLPTCTCQPAVCGNMVLEPGEVCELPQVGCGPFQVCVACMQCAP